MTNSTHGHQQQQQQQQQQQHVFYLPYDRGGRHVEYVSPFCKVTLLKDLLLRFSSFSLGAENRGGAYPQEDFHWFVLLND